MLAVLRIALQIVCLISNRTGSRSWHHKQTLHQTTSLFGRPSPSSMPPSVPLSWSSTFHTSDLPIWNQCFQYILPPVWHLSISSIIINTWIFLCSGITAYFLQDTESVLVWNSSCPHRMRITWSYKESITALGMQGYSPPARRSLQNKTTNYN